MQLVSIPVNIHLQFPCSVSGFQVRDRYCESKTEKLNNPTIGLKTEKGGLGFQEK